MGAVFISCPSFLWKYNIYYDYTFLYRACFYHEMELIILARAPVPPNGNDVPLLQESASFDRPQVRLQS